MQSTLNTELLAGMLKNKRGNKGLRAVADEIGGVSFATLSRIEQGKVPDVDTFIRICKWLEVIKDAHSAAAAVSTKDHVVAHLRADKALSNTMSDMLINMINMAYNSK